MTKGYSFRGSHTQNEGHSMHALIEKRSKGLTIFTPSEWVKVIKTAMNGKTPYTVIDVGRKSIIDFKSLGKNQNWEKDTTGEKV